MTLREICKIGRTYESMAIESSQGQYTIKFGSYDGGDD
jgi:hypothetical protein